MRSKISLRRCTDDRYGCPGVITVFLAIAFACIVSLILALTESVRTAGIRCYAQTAAGSAIDSLFSEFHNKLWDDYGLLFFVEGDETVIQGKILEYMKPYAEIDGWFPFEADRAELKKVTTAVSDGGEWLEQEIADHLTYGGLAEELLKQDAGETADEQELILKEVKDAQVIQSVSDDFGAYYGEIEKIEDYIGKIDRNLQDQGTQAQAIREAISGADASGFARAKGNLGSLINSLSSLISRYIDRADKLDEKLEKTRSEHLSEMEQMSDENREILERQIESYREYSRQNSERREEIEGLITYNEMNAEVLARTAEEANEAEDRINALMEEAYHSAEERRKNGEKDVQVDAVDETGEWACVNDVFDDFVLPSLNVTYGVGDAHKESVLKNVLSMLGGGIMDLCIPEGKEISDGIIYDTVLPSGLCRELRSGPQPDVIRRLLIDQYISMYFESYTDAAEKEKSEKNLRYEVEYILSGALTDRENMESVLGDLFAIREGLNFIHIMRDENLNSEVRALSDAIASGVGLPPLKLVIEALIYAAWSGAESIMDIRDLLSGREVPLLKGTEDWHLSVEGMMNFGESGVLEQTPSESKEGEPEDKAKGQTYEKYLDIMLKLLNCEDKNYRMMDLIQDNIRRSDEYFLMSESVYGVDADIICSAAHLYGGLSSYEVKVHVSKAY